MKKKRMKCLVALLLILCITLFVVFFFCNDHSQEQFEEEAAVSVAVPDISQAEGEPPAIEDEKKGLVVFISENQENDYDVVIPES